MNENPGIEVTTHRENEDIDINELKLCIISLLQDLLGDVFEIF